MTDSAAVLALTSSDHCLGPREARVTIIEYGDFECPNCKQAEAVVKRLVERHRSDVCLAFRHFPLAEVHAYALLAAQAVEAAAAQGKFWPMHDLLFEHQDLLDQAHLETFAAQIGLDLSRFGADMRNATYLSTVRQQMDGAAACGVRATPTFFVNGVMQDVSFGLERLYQRVESLLQQPG
jgi:protein-disulfide isomerase